MDAEAYRKVVQGAKDRVFGYAARLLGDREEARDVAQEALVRLWEHRSDVTGDEAARAWLLRTAHNLCFDRLRLRSARPQADAETVLPLVAGREADGPAHAFDRRETGRALERVLAQLAPRDRAVLLLRDVHGMSYEEAAGLLGLPLGTLKAALHRARERARVLLLAAGVRP